MLELDAPRRVGAGTSAALVLRLRNTGSQPATLYLRGRHIAFDFLVTNQQGVVWQRLHGQTVPAIARVVDLAAGEVMEFRETWPLTNNDGRPVAAGSYSVEGLLLREEPEPMRTTVHQLDVSG